jgi:nuclease-like protein
MLRPLRPGRRQRAGHGEAWTASRLDQHLKGTEVTLLHDRRIPASRAHIDHIAVGRGGIVVIGSHRWEGTPRVRGAHLMVAGRNRTKIVHSIERQAAIVSEVLEGTPYEGAKVEAALCWVNYSERPLSRTMQIGGVVIDAPKKIARLAARPGRWSVADIDQVAAILAERLRPA